MEHGGMPRVRRSTGCRARDSGRGQPHRGVPRLRSCVLWTGRASGASRRSARVPAWTSAGHRKHPNSCASEPCPVAGASCAGHTGFLSRHPWRIFLRARADAASHSLNPIPRVLLTGKFCLPREFFPGMECGDMRRRGDVRWHVACSNRYPHNRRFSYDCDCHP